MNIEKQKKMT